MKEEWVPADTLGCLMREINGLMHETESTMHENNGSMNDMANHPQYLKASSGKETACIISFLLSLFQ
ncbi:hypothetical protein [Evansella clarkii]|uniref:hypothetical protein n=1 Tax=Evansella clarkii TaxID=79879 RepID=UPI0014310438|nr:hypothetical protein [Evansella clarkii]